jgi:Polyketide cyclase / dehydrase and lipid transport
MPPIVTTAEIERPASEVFAYATDPVRFSEWQKGVVDGHMDGPGNGTQAPAVGAKCVTTRRIGGANRPATSELVHIDPPRTWGVRGIDGPIRAAVDVLVEPVTDARSRLTISVDFTGQGIGKILVPLMVRPEARKEMPANMAALRRRMEAR